MRKKQPEKINFREFLKSSPTAKTKTVMSLPVLSVIPLHPAALIDPVFLGIGAGVLLVALIEKGLADTGFVSIAAVLSAFLRISFPIAGIGALWYLINDMTFLFW